MNQAEQVVTQKNTSLKEHHTFQLSATAQYFTSINTAQQLQTLVTMPLWQDQPHIVLGEGSNTLFVKDFAGIVVRNQIKSIKTIDENDETIWLEIGAGENWHQFVCYCIERNYGGVENLSLIPGTVGAAPMQNIGAYGAEIKDVFESLVAVDVSTGKKQTFDKSDCEFAYRDSVFKNTAAGQYIIASVTLKLPKKPSFNVSYASLHAHLADVPKASLSLAVISQAVMDIRLSKLPDPAVLPNAGSFFKNTIVPRDQFASLQALYPQIPHYSHDDQVKIPSAWLIEQCGWKGKRQGPVGVYEHQALVLVNYGGASGAQLLSLAGDIQTDVNEKFGIQLEPEVRII